MASATNFTKGTDEAVFGFICRWAADHRGNTPSISEIMVGLSLSRWITWRTVNRLIQLGKIERRSNRLEVVGSKWSYNGIT